MMFSAGSTKDAGDCFEGGGSGVLGDGVTTRVIRIVRDGVQQARNEGRRRECRPP